MSNLETDLNSLQEEISTIVVGNGKNPLYRTGGDMTGLDADSPEFADHLRSICDLTAWINANNPHGLTVKGYVEWGEDGAR